jgi:hypothetical protein
MRSSYNVLVTWLAVLAFAATASWAAVQQDPGRRNPANPQDPARSTVREQVRQGADAIRSQEVRTMPGADHFFLSCLKAESENEIALAKFAQQRAQNEEVKKRNRDPTKGSAPWTWRDPRGHPYPGARGRRDGPHPTGGSLHVRRRSGHDAVKEGAKPAVPGDADD